MILLDWYNKYIKRRGLTGYVIIAALVAVVLGGSLWGYRWYERRYNERAQAALARCVELWEKALQDKQENVMEQARRDISIEHERFARSSLAPYFLVLGSDLALQRADKVKAVEFIEKALAGLPVDSPLYGFYAVKKALMKIDAADETTRRAGATELQALSLDAKNKNRDMALYYRGLIAFDRGDRPGAEEIWRELQSRFGKDSLWARIAQAKLDYTA